MPCPECSATYIRKNGTKKDEQNHLCVTCSHQFIDAYESTCGYSDAVKTQCLKMYVNGSGFCAIEQQVGAHLPDADNPETTPAVGELDALEAFVGSKKQNLALDCRRPLSSKGF